MARPQPPRSRASRIRVRVQPRRPIDLQKLGRAVIELAQRELDAERQGSQSTDRKPDEGAAA